MLLPRSRLALVIGACVLTSCHHRDPVQAVHPHYVLGGAWQGSNGWFYPAERFDLQETGLAVRQTPPAGGVMADGVVWSARALSGGHQTLQLPAVVTVRNLANGRSMRIRLDDRGPRDSGRMLSVTPHVADLLGMGAGPTPVEIVEDETLSRRIAESSPDAPKLDITAAPREAVVAQSLDDGSTQTIGAKPAVQERAPTSLYVPDLPETVVQGPLGVPVYRVVLGTFTGRGAASGVALQCGALVSATPGGAGSLPWEVALGPFTTVAEADRALDQAHRCGGTGAHIVVR